MTFSQELLDRLASPRLIRWTETSHGRFIDSLRRNNDPV